MAIQVYFLAIEDNEKPLHLDYIGDAEQLEQSLQMLGMLNDIDPLPSPSVDAGSGCDFFQSSALEQRANCAHPTTTQRDPIVVHETGELIGRH